MPSCSAIGCSNTSSSYKDRKVTLHRFPVRDKELAELWVYNMNRDGFVPNKNSRLCSDHFLPECFEEDKYAKYGLSRGSRKRLTKEAVPTENFPYGPRNRPATTVSYLRENTLPHQISQQAPIFVQVLPLRVPQISEVGRKTVLHSRIILLY